MVLVKEFFLIKRDLYFIYKCDKIKLFKLKRATHRIPTFGLPPQPAQTRIS